jgi:hypothetical protein
MFLCFTFLLRYSTGASVMSTGCAPPPASEDSLELCQPDSFFDEARLHGTKITVKLAMDILRCLDVRSVTYVVPCLASVDRHIHARSVST